MLKVIEVIEVIVTINSNGDSVDRHGRVRAECGLSAG